MNIWSQHCELPAPAAGRELKVVPVYEPQESAWPGEQQKLLSQVYGDAVKGKFDVSSVSVGPAEQGAPSTAGPTTARLSSPSMSIPFPGPASSRWSSRPSWSGSMWVRVSPSAPEIEHDGSPWGLSRGFQFSPISARAKLQRLTDCISAG